MPQSNEVIIEQLLEEVDELKNMLKEVEFIYDSELDEYRCPVCAESEESGHSPNCKLNKLIGE